MKNNIIATGILALGLITGFTTSSAQAGLSDLTNAAITAGEVTLVQFETNNTFGTPSLAASADIKLNGSDHGVSAGLFRLKEQGQMNELLAFCVEIEQNLTFATTYNIVDTLFASAVESRLAKLFNTYLSGVSTSTAAAGFQIAIWEIVNDATLNLSIGDFLVNTASTGVTAAAQGFLTGIDGKSEGTVELTFLTSATGQDLIIWDDFGTSIVSAPASAILLMFGIGGLVMVKRKKA